MDIISENDNYLTEGFMHEYMMDYYKNHFHNILISQMIKSYKHDNLKLDQGNLTQRKGSFSTLISLITNVIDKITGHGSEDLCIQLLDKDGFLLYVFTWTEVPTGSHFSVIEHSHDELMSNKIVNSDIYLDYHYNKVYGGCLMFPIFNLSRSLEAVVLIGSRNFFPIDKMKLQEIFSQIIEVQIKYHNCLRIQRYSSSLIDEIPEYVVLFDENANIIAANKRFSDLIGVPKYQLQGMNLRNLFDDLHLQEDDYFKNLWNKELNTIVNNRKHNLKIILQKVLSLPYGIFQNLIILKVENKEPYPATGSDLITASRSAFYDIVGETIEIKQIITRAQKIASTPSNVLILGESGTGKELLAKAIHLQSGRNGPFVAINCGAIPRELLQSELFGYAEGTFTGGQKGGKTGKLEMADNGTVFLDEIGEMPADMQVSLLRFLQDRMVVRLGSTKGKLVNVRIIAATHQDLKQAIQAKTFREDLYYRLNVFQFVMPPLRQRKNDIPLLASHMMKDLCVKYGLRIPIMGTKVMDVLENYDWPGNVRELHNIIEVMLFSCQDSLITTDLLPQAISAQNNSKLPLTPASSLQDYEKEIIKNSLLEHKGNLSETAKALGISRKTLYNKRKSLGINI